MLFRLKDFPNLSPGNHRDTGLADGKCNCIAWAAGIDNDWWDPATNRYWPANAPRDYKVTSLIVAFESVGYAVCADGALEDGVEKVAIFADGPEYMHAARQLQTGKWTSKMGPDEQIEHDTPNDLAGPAYGDVTTYMKRLRPPA